MFYIYILYSNQADRYYIGFTSTEISDRLQRHNSNHTGYTGKWNDWEVVYTESYLTKEEAIRRENQIKSWKSRKMIERIIN